MSRTTLARTAVVAGAVGALALTGSGTAAAETEVPEPATSTPQPARSTWMVG